jgi:hypothetical protein
LAGQTTQGESAIAIGFQAGMTTQGANAIAIGYGAGQVAQGENAVALGTSAGTNGQGANAVAIGYLAGVSSSDTTPQPANSIVINATGGYLPALQEGAFYVSPIRAVSDVTALSPLYYDPATGEIVAYSPPP